MEFQPDFDNLRQVDIRPESVVSNLNLTAFRPAAGCLTGCISTLLGPTEIERKRTTVVLAGRERKKAIRKEGQ